MQATRIPCVNITLNQNLTLNYARTSLPVNTDINTFLQDVAEKLYPAYIDLIALTSWTASGAGATVSQSTVLTTKSGTTNAPSFMSPVFDALETQKTLHITGTITANWGNMNIDAKVNGTWSNRMNKAINGSMNENVTLPQGTTQIRIAGFAAVNNATDTYTVMRIQ